MRHINTISRPDLAVLPDYLVRTYQWAYLTPSNMRVLDRSLVVSSILWGNHRRLIREALSEIEPGSRVLQPACVYGDFSCRLIDHLGGGGHLTLADVAGVQLDNARTKLTNRENIDFKILNAAEPGAGEYDAVLTYFLLHEMPDEVKRDAVKNLLERVRPGGKAIFVDYHRPAGWHPLRPVMSLVFRLLEPFARAMWDTSIEQMAAGEGQNRTDFSWSKRTLFGGMYQVVVAKRAAER